MFAVIKLRGGDWWAGPAYDSVTQARQEAQKLIDSGAEPIVYTIRLIGKQGAYTVDRSFVPEEGK